MCFAHVECALHTSCSTPSEIPDPPAIERELSNYSNRIFSRVGSAMKSAFTYIERDLIILAYIAPPLNPPTDGSV